VSEAKLRVGEVLMVSELPGYLAAYLSAKQREIQAP
jgi:hypothetical protein